MTLSVREKVHAMLAFGVAAAVSAYVVFFLFLRGRGGRAAASMVGLGEENVLPNVILFSMISAATITAMLWPRYKSEKSISNGLLSLGIALASYPMTIFSIVVFQQGPIVGVSELKLVLKLSAFAAMFTFWITIPAALVAGSVVCLIHRRSKNHPPVVSFRLFKRERGDA